MVDRCLPAAASERWCVWLRRAHATCGHTLSCRTAQLQSADRAPRASLRAVKGTHLRSLTLPLTRLPTAQNTGLPLEPVPQGPRWHEQGQLPAPPDFLHDATVYSATACLALPLLHGPADTILGLLWIALAPLDSAPNSPSAPHAHSSSAGASGTTTAGTSATLAVPSPPSSPEHQPQEQQPPQRAAGAVALLRDPAVQQQLAVAASMAVAQPHAGYLPWIAGVLHRMAGSASLAALLQELTAALAEEARQRHLLDLTVWVAAMPHVTASVGYLLESMPSGGSAGTCAGDVPGGGAAGGFGAAAAAAAGGVAPTASRQLRQPSGTS